MRNHVRRGILDDSINESDLEEDREIIWRYISNPAKQLDLIVGVDGLRRIIALTKQPSIPLSFRNVSCSWEAVKWMIDGNLLPTRSLLSLSSPQTSWNCLTSNNTELMQLESLSINILSISTKIPFIPSLRKLSLVDGDSLVEIADEYCTHLEELGFVNCSGLENVTGFGSIPSISITDCNNLLDISALRNNRKVQLITCEGILDYSQGFENSEFIKLRICTSRSKLNLDNWKNVRNLQIIVDKNTTIELTGSSDLPRSLKRCHLHGQISDLMDYSYLPPHLQEMWIDKNKSINELRNLFALDIPVLRLDSLSNLSSLKGLGKRVECLTLENYYHDYSAVESVHRSLTLNFSGKVPLEFENTVVVHTKEFILKGRRCSAAFEFIEGKVDMIDLRVYDSFIPFSTIQKIPVILLSMNCYLSFRDYLSAGGRIYNEKIEIWATKGSVFDSFHYRVKSIYQDHLQVMGYSMLIHRFHFLFRCIFLQKD